MPWTLLDVAIYVVFALLLVGSAFVLYTRVRAFLKALSGASATLADASTSLSVSPAKPSARR